MRILLAQLNPTVGDLEGNRAKILSAMEKGEGADLLLFPELALCGYPPDDLLLLPHFIVEMERSLEIIAAATKKTTLVVGVAKREGGNLYNSAAILREGGVVGYQHKMRLPTYDVFDERRYFTPAKENQCWEIGGKRVGITLCEDIWPSSHYEQDPLLLLKEQKIDLLLNLSSSPYSFDRFSTRQAIYQKVIEVIGCPLLLCNQVGANDSLLFDGYSLWMDPQGIKKQGRGFEEDWISVDLPGEGESAPKPDPIGDLYQALVMGVRDYFTKQGLTKACLGLSGGIDSALVAHIGVDALGPENLLPVMMPSRYSTEEGMIDARKLAENLQLTLKEIPIEKPFQTYLDLLAPHFSGKKSDVTEENLQARIRGMILMALSNKLGHLVLSTGNKSELAMGYTTLYGDMCGGLAVISDVSKVQVVQLCRWLNREEERIPSRILEKPPSAELRPNQKDQDTLPDYAIIDAILEDYVERHLSPHRIAEKRNFPIKLVEEMVVRILKNEYKRRQAPLGLRVTSKAFSVGRRFPIVHRWRDAFLSDESP